MEFRLRRISAQNSTSIYPGSTIFSEKLGEIYRLLEKVQRFICFIPRLDAISRVFVTWGSVSSTDHGGSRIFPAIWLAVPLGANGAHLGICTLPDYIFLVRNKLFRGEMKFSQRRTRPVKSLWWQIVHMQESTNEWKNVAFFLNIETCGNTMVIPQTIDKVNIRLF